MPRKEFKVKRIVEHDLLIATKVDQKIQIAKRGSASMAALLIVSQLRDFSHALIA